LDRAAVHAAVMVSEVDAKHLHASTLTFLKAHLADRH